MTFLVFITLIICLFCEYITVSAYRSLPKHCMINRRNLNIHMGIGDMFSKAFANEALPPPKNPGLSRELEPVIIEFLPAKKVIKALPGQ